MSLIRIVSPILPIIIVYRSDEHQNLRHFNSDNYIFSFSAMYVFLLETDLHKESSSHSTMIKGIELTIRTGIKQEK